MKEWGVNQQAVAEWSSGVTPPSMSTPRAQFNRSQEEFTELDKATLEDDGSRASREAIAGETADVVIRMYGLAAIVGFDLDERVAEKMRLARDKYPIKVIQARIEAGGEFNHVMAQEKTVYENRTPHQKRWDKRLI